ncbi:16S rRNA (uracil1498-N3)-methyltransferase [Anaerosolibacter carboniphilus]|uniref:Ribosomal RNA small subunit methyltransferase E n=1 Tax=Anaerosolibacter carboniphilus TaxID=1417629 RepID=A0A841KWC1_9FIRM|nr:16S rRNA (uracil(1498)-N(3))-methyltransferase [Anaerosolibacter carboniphilus]MBB6217934.1 16S rRNA (uracil1498-N3)-methyltransferase [Anaerosolibacter carboniphilus]
MNRFFVDKQNIVEDMQQIVIDDPDDVKHIQRVLRLEQGDAVEICDGQNMEYIAEISSMDKSVIRLNIVEKWAGSTEPPIEITLFQGIPKATKMDVIIQKCTELGISRIVPVITERTIVQLKDQKSEEKKVERWQKIADEAAKQCKRGIIPRIELPMVFSEAIKDIQDFDLTLIPYEREVSLGLKGVLRQQVGATKIGIYIGPEGGFGEKEIEGAKKAGIVPVTLGPRILRTETAGFTALSILMYELGDLGGI